MLRKTIVALVFLIFSHQINAANSMLGGIITVTEQQIGQMVKLSGTVIPITKSNLLAQMSGRIEFVAGKEGDRFSKGAELLRISSDELTAQLDAARSSERQALAQLNNSKIQHNSELISPKRNATQGGMGAMSMFDNLILSPMTDKMGYNNYGIERHASVYQLRINITKAYEDVARARAKIQAIKTKFRDLQTLAPYTGVIIKKFVEIGDPVQPSRQLMVFADLSQLQVEINVPARFIYGLHEGDILSVRLDNSHALLNARVAQIFPDANAQHTVTVKLDLPRSNTGAPGMFASVWITDHQAEIKMIPVIPETAIRRRNTSLPGVYVIDQTTNRPQLRLIRIGQRKSNEMRSVLSGLTQGERILVNPKGYDGW